MAPGINIKYYGTMKSIYLLTLLCLFTVSCNGQTKPVQDNGPQQTTTSAGQPRIVKSQGTSEYDNVHCGLQDKAGNMWFGTTGEGVYKYDGKTFTNYTTKDGLAHNQVWCVYEDKAGNIWFGTGDGATCFDGHNLANFKISGSSELNAVWSIFEDKNGLFWFGTTDGIYRYDRPGSLATGSKPFIPLLSDKSIQNPLGLNLQYVQGIVEDKNGNIVFASSSNEGICMFDGKSISCVKTGFGRIMSVLKEKNGDMIFGTATGADRYDGTTFTSLTEKADPRMWVYGVLKDSKSNLWFCTERGMGPEYKDGGLWRYDGKEYTRFTTKDGLPSNAVFCIVEDKDGNIWAGTRRMGLCRYNPTTNTFSSFSDTVGY
jgi:ligand-binding sensor domain-containing protein